MMPVLNQPFYAAILNKLKGFYTELFCLGVLHSITIVIVEHQSIYILGDMKGLYLQPTPN